jgi:hypothetical protein
LVKKGEALSAAELGLGFPARKEEIRRFGSVSRRITRALPKWFTTGPSRKWRPCMPEEEEAYRREGGWDRARAIERLQGDSRKKEELTTVKVITGIERETSMI